MTFGPSDPMRPVPPEQVFASPLTDDEAELRVNQLRPTPGKYYQKLKGLYGGIGMAVFPFDPSCASAILVNAEETARAMDALAREHRSVARIVDYMLSVSTFGMVLGAHAPIMMAIFQHHAPEGMREAMTAALHMQTGEPVRNAETNGGPR